MTDLGYMLAAVAIGGLITVLLRAVPFAILKPLRRSRFVKSIGEWMPAGLLLILAIVILASQIEAHPGKLWVVAIATVATVLVHVFLGRRALLSIFAGTAVYVVLLNLT